MGLPHNLTKSLRNKPILTCMFIKMFIETFYNYSYVLKVESMFLENKHNIKYEVRREESSSIFIRVLLDFVMGNQ